jgi:hypothetical protein
VHLTWNNCGKSNGLLFLDSSQGEAAGRESFLSMRLGMERVCAVPAGPARASTWQSLMALSTLG